jgi:3-polyprenyl-4-hydroxybenzoate decarboxylase
VRDPADVLDHVTSEMTIGSKLGIDATKKTAR